MANINYDPECVRLARYFLAGESGTTEERIQELAGTIQEAVEAWIREKWKASP